MIKFDRLPPSLQSNEIEENCDQWDHRYRIRYFSAYLYNLKIDKKSLSLIKKKLEIHFEIDFFEFYIFSNFFDKPSNIVWTILAMTGDKLIRELIAYAVNTIC